MFIPWPKLFCPDLPCALLGNKDAPKIPTTHFIEWPTVLPPGQGPLLSIFLHKPCGWALANSPSAVPRREWIPPPLWGKQAQGLFDWGLSSPQAAAVTRGKVQVALRQMADFAQGHLGRK